jgi:16S rRNA (adenine1518-N6/adenine1519-N6)-dimethyltransferase
VSLPPLDVPALLRRHRLRPDKRLGQNFLIDDQALASIVEAGDPGPEDSVLEIGPGLGSLTRLLAQRAGRVLAVELDTGLIPALQEVVGDAPNVRVIEGDILRLNLRAILEEEGDGALAGESTHGGYLVIANIPYHITSALIRYLLENNLPPKRMVLTIQKEVAERICAEPGGMSMLAVSVQIYGRPEIRAHIPAESFYPPPQVDSAVLRVDRYAEPLVPAELLPLTFRLAKAGFSQKRKTLRNAISAGMHWRPDQAAEYLTTAGIAPQRRAETLSLEEWGALARYVNEQVDI